MPPPGRTPAAGVARRYLRCCAAAYERAMMAAGCAMLGAIVVIMGVQVFYRYVLNDSLIWAEEMSRYLLVWISFLFLGIAFQRGEMIALTLLLRNVPRWAVALLSLLAYGTGIAFLAILVWYGFKFAAVNDIQTLPAFDFVWSAIAGPRQTLDVSAWWLYAAVPVGAALLALHMLAAMVTRFAALAAGRDPFAGPV